MSQKKSSYGFPVTVEEPVIGEREKDNDESGPADPRVRCPACDWSPKPTSKWRCVCTHSWNTFDTGGICPQCMFQWSATECLSCGVWSAHSAWYTHSES